MMRKLEEISWGGLFPLTADGVELADFAELHNGKSILVTGAGGSIGTALVRAITKFNLSQLILLDSSEQNLYSIHKQLSFQHIQHVPVLGSVADDRCLRDTFVR